MDTSELLPGKTSLSRFKTPKRQLTQLWQPAKPDCQNQAGERSVTSQELTTPNIAVLTGMSFKLFIENFFILVLSFRFEIRTLR
jgi:hypothetical protein